MRLLQIGEYDQTVAAFGVVIRRLPDFAEAYHGRGLAHFHDERLDLALEDFDHAIELKPDLADAYVSRAALYMERGRVSNVIADLEKALSLYDPVRDAAEVAEVTRLLDELRR